MFVNMKMFLSGTLLQKWNDRFWPFFNLYLNYTLQFFTLTYTHAVGNFCEQ